MISVLDIRQLAIRQSSIHFNKMAWWLDSDRESEMHVDPLKASLITLGRSFEHNILIGE